MGTAGLRGERGKKRLTRFLCDVSLFSLTRPERPWWSRLRCAGTRDEPPRPQRVTGSGFHPRAGLGPKMDQPGAQNITTEDGPDLAQHTGRRL